MRIISGNHKGRHISVYKNFKDRPTTDFAKEALFNILNNQYYFDEIRVLDLFAGTGSISFEFASHGTTDITMVDSNAKYTEFIRNQAEEIFPDIKFNIITADVFDFIKSVPLDYDVIFADPPYGLAELSTLPDLIFSNAEITDNALFILEHSKANKFNEHPFFIKERKYGKVHFSMFSRQK